MKLEESLAELYEMCRFDAQGLPIPDSRQIPQMASERYDCQGMELTQVAGPGHLGSALQVTNS